MGEQRGISSARGVASDLFERQDTVSRFSEATLHPSIIIHEAVEGDGEAQHDQNEWEEQQEKMVVSLSDNYEQSKDPLMRLSNPSTKSALATGE
ncbi:hypothetical protein McanMca71_002373 [Microsporum canis]